LQSSSPAINAGTPVGLTTDILGNPIVGNPDIGAYEYENPFSTSISFVKQGEFFLIAGGKIIIIQDQ
jgi:hypothetical protein